MAGIVGAWDFSADISSERVTDRTSHALHGKTVNFPTRGMTGHNWDGTEQSWRQAPEKYGAIHFHEDDLYDAEWETDFEWIVPEGTRSGVYAARLRGLDEKGVEDHVPFFVRPPL